jgi:hypothetical protein
VPEIPPGPPPISPVDVSGVRTVAAGTVLFGLAFVVLLFFRDELRERDLDWWLWTCLAGFGLGLLGLEYTRSRRDAITRLRDEPAPDDSSGPPPA